MSGCQCPDLCGRDHYPDDGCGRRARFVKETQGRGWPVYHVCVECAEEIVARGRGVVLTAARHASDDAAPGWDAPVKWWAFWDAIAEFLWLERPVDCAEVPYARAFVARSVLGS